MPPRGCATSVSDEMRARIVQTLDEIERDNGVHVLFAVESGSRAWGFPSPDSDYDVRFVYTHPLDWYLSLQPGRDVIERPIDDTLDISGWDIRKMLSLLVKSNATALEWLSVPIRYRWDDAICARLAGFAAEAAHATACRRHYLSLCESVLRGSTPGEAVTIKKQLYALRAALALRWIRTHDDAPPPNLQALVAGLDLDPETVELITELITVKTRTREAGEIARAPLLDALIAEALDWARAEPDTPMRADLGDKADALFREIVKANALTPPAG